MRCIIVCISFIGSVLLLCSGAPALANSQAECELGLERCRARCHNQFPTAIPGNLRKLNQCIRQNCTDRCEQHGPELGIPLEDAARFVPRRLVHSDGKAFTECAEGEQEQTLRGRKICVNAQGDYYFLAD